jgi:uncharacterized protein
MEKINVKNLLISEVGTRLTFDINEAIKVIGLPSEIEGKKVVGKLKATRLEDTVLVSGEFVAGTVLICDRCLENFKAHIPFTLEREYNLNRSKESVEELIVDKFGEIDVTEPIREEIILAIPMKNICDEKCEGICAKCGVNLNKEECKCKIKKKRRK